MSQYSECQIDYPISLILRLENGRFDRQARVIYFGLKVKVQKPYELAMITC